MRLSVTSEYRFERTPEGAVWTRSSFSRPFWDRYLAVFDTVRVVARLQDVAGAPEGAKRVDDERVSFLALPYYVGPTQYLALWRRVAATTRSAIGADEALILRVPSQISNVVTKALPVERPFGLEVVGDPYDVFAPGAVGHPLRRYFRWSFQRTLRRQCRSAAGIGYVTEAALQRRYPPGPSTFATHYSSIELRADAFVAAPRKEQPVSGTRSMLLVGSLAQLYKAPDIAIDAVRLLTAEGMGLRLTIVGDGKFRGSLERLAAERGIGDRVVFRGELPAGRAVRDEVDAVDLFVLPSRTEGLPRAMIEAMARGLPCIGSTVGGIPELLPPEDLVPPGDARALADKIAEVLRDPARMARMSARNLAKAAEYREDVLRERRTAFYRHLRQATEAWIAERDGGQ